MDKLEYFDVRARAEPVRMLYGLSGTKYEDERVGNEAWEVRKTELILGQLPVLHTADGMVNGSNTIARYVAKKLGMMGKGLWEETLHDMVVETVMENWNKALSKVCMWKVFKMAPEPEDSEKVVEEVAASLKKCLNYIQSIAEKRGKKFIVGDELGLAEIWFFTALENIRAAFPDIMSMTEWTKQITDKIAGEEKVKAYIESRPKPAYDL